MINQGLEYKFFLLLLILVTLGFCWILLPFHGAIFWAVSLAILFRPLQCRLEHLSKGRWRNLISLITLSACLVVAVLPVTVMVSLLVEEGAELFKQIESGSVDFQSFIERIRTLLPHPLNIQLSRFGLDNLGGLRDRIASGAMQASQFLATKAFNIGQNTFQFILSSFVMLYLLFFFLRDGPVLVARVTQAIPLEEAQKHRLLRRLTRVVRATIKGNILVAIAQGAIGGLIFALMGIPSALVWGVVMAFLSLLPTVGAALIWAPIALYWMLSGEVWRGVVLTLFGVCVIGLVDNLMRPFLVGKDTKMPDYLVLVTTLGGLALFGLNGFVIGPLIAALFISIWGLFSEPEDRDASDG